MANTPTLDPALLDAILDSLKDPLLLADTDHVIRYMNSAAAAHYEEGRALLGRSLLDCHNEQSRAVMHEVLAVLQAGETERLITDKPEQRIYMRAVRDARGELIGYYERYETSPTPAS
jgi:PAS domain-containing protein